MNKAYYLSLSTQLQDLDDNEEVDDETKCCTSNIQVIIDEDEQDSEDSDDETCHKTFSENLTNQLIDESIDQLNKYDQFACGLVDDLFDELRAAQAAQNVDLTSPLSILIPAVNNESGLDSTVTPTTYPVSTYTSSTTTTTSSVSQSNSQGIGWHGYYHFGAAKGYMFRRHSADVEKILLRANE